MNGIGNWNGLDIDRVVSLSNWSWCKQIIHFAWHGNNRWLAPHVDTIPSRAVAHPRDYYFIDKSCCFERESVDIRRHRPKPNRAKVKSSNEKVRNRYLVIVVAAAVLVVIVVVVAVIFEKMYVLSTT